MEGTLILWKFGSFERRVKDEGFLVLSLSLSFLSLWEKNPDDGCHLLLCMEIKNLKLLNYPSRFIDLFLLFFIYLIFNKNI